MFTIEEDDVGLANISYDNGIEYEGQVIGARPHGPGKLRCVDDSVYEGTFFYGSPTGEGVWSMPGRPSVRGRWEFGQFVVKSEVTANSE